MPIGSTGSVRRHARRMLTFLAGASWLALWAGTVAAEQAAPKWQPGRWTPLFFYDEAVALAAGHRPCALCRRADFNRWMDAWEAAFGERPSVDPMDRRIETADLQRRPQVPRLHQAAAAIHNNPVAKRIRGDRVHRGLRVSLLIGGVEQVG